jgi:FtsH-binding integral membrane protein
MLEASESVFSRKKATGKIISARMYNMIIGLTLGWGFWINYLMVTNISAESIWAFFGGNVWILLGFYFVSCFVGTYLFSSSDNPLVSFIGYNLVVIPIGVIITPLVQSYDPAIVEKALLATGMVTAIMMMLGVMYPAFFAGIARALGIALLVTIIAEVGMSFIFKIHSGVVDWIVAAIFCGYIGYDWGRANAIPKTVDNAIDSAASLYIDIINLFIRILSILGRR